MPRVALLAGGRRQQGVEQDVDVADGGRLVVADEVERVVAGGFGVRQVQGLAELRLMVDDDAERLALGIDEHGRAGPAPAAGRQVVEGDFRALARAWRSDGEGASLHVPGDQGRGSSRIALSEQDAAASGELPHVGRAEEASLAVEVRPGGFPAFAAADSGDVRQRAAGSLARTVGAASSTTERGRWRRVGCLAALPARA